MVKKIVRILYDNPKIKIGKNIVVGLIGVECLSLVLPTFSETAREGVIYSNSFLSFFFMVLGVLTYVKITQNSIKKNKIVAYFLSFFYAVCLVTGRELESVDNFDVTKISSYFCILFIGLFLAPFIYAIWNLIQQKREIEDIGKKKSYLARNTILLLLFWLPVFLAFYPGAFVYDAWDEYQQVAMGKYTTHHPLLHVLFLGKVVCYSKHFWNNANIGIAAYTIVQMIIMAIILSYSLEFAGKKWSKIEGMGILFYGLFPLFPMYAVCSSKDTLFTSFLLLTVVNIMKIYEKGWEKVEKKEIICFIISCTLMLLFRNNGVYAYFVWLILAFFIWYAGSIRLKKKKEWNLILFCLPVIIYFLLSFILTNQLSAKKGGSQEIMTVPIQQMARVYKYAPESYTEEEKEILYEILPENELHLYTPRISDLLKSKFNNQAFRQDKLKYLSLWTKMGIRNPFIYLNAWLLTSYGYWYPDAVINVYGGMGRNTYTYEESSYFGFETEPPGKRESKFLWLEEQYRKISLELYQQKVPGISMLFSSGFLSWCYIFCMGFLIREKEWKKLIPLLLILLVWSTVLLGPTYLVRYVLILWFAVPVLVSMVITKEN